MNVRPETAKAVRTAERLLSSAPQGKLDPFALDKHVGKAVRLLVQEAPQWIGLAHATRLLGVATDETPRTLARMGLLRSRSTDDGQFELRLDDVLHRRLEAEALLGFGGEEMTPEFVPAWSEWIIAETWRVLAWQWRVGIAPMGAGDHRALSATANQMLRYLLPVMRLVTLRGYAGPGPWPELQDRDDEPVWETAVVAGAR
jgi:hypothetical protein